MFDLKTIIKAKTIDQAVKLLIENPDAKLIAGGTDVLIKLKQGKDGYARLVDIHDLEALNYIRFDDEKNILIGSGVVFSQIIQSDIIRDTIPMLCEAAKSVGGPQIRNIATMGGNICNGVPSADSAPSLFALNALLVIQREKGVRQIPIADFYKGPGRVNLNQGDVLIGFKITRDNYQGYKGCYYKYAMRNAMDIATIGCAVSLKTKNHVLVDYRIAYGVAGPVPLRCHATEQAVLHQAVSNALVDKISETVENDVNPRTSWRASRDFRMNIIKELSKRVTKEVFKRAGEKL
ncbi:MAG: xanthine dehydrogenase FAD-binding subunit XdhB [Desulfobacula sp.]|uniref:xanthine dehydrogenase subunit XdhB n=1 Tax=Desulfobacula sp. TaxID=2593537 RepID=UPI0025BEF310|nr:xanthine dehydrogenase subunit XdhB [Desulfobacula sp.]MCD4719548.1 xanthine dehydrogenase FAD-binding subunit XdhB [Desulfobacula sp.]